MSLYSQIRGKAPRALAEKYEARLARIYALAKKRRDALSAASQCRRNARPVATVDKDYGPNPEEPDLDIVDPEAYARSLEFHKEKLTDLRARRETVERETVEQWRSDDWVKYRKQLLTASHFGKICRMRAGTSCKNIVTSILYPNVGSKVPALEWGRAREKDARVDLERQSGVQINDSGLFIDPEILGLGATPDGLIGNDGIVEIKCPYAARKMTPDEAISNKIAGIHRVFGDVSGTSMNPVHEYYYQVQGQLHVTRRDYCLFMVWTLLGSKILRVDRDDHFWKTKMESRLIKFYEDCLLPEIVNSRYKRNMPIRDPSYVVEAQESLKRKRQEKLDRRANELEAPEEFEINQGE